MITQARLKELVSYDPNTGLFQWNYSWGSRRKRGEVAGRLHHSGAIELILDNKFYRAHRLAWIYIYGDSSVDGYEVDHKDRDQTNNKLENLRLASRSQNAMNRAKQCNNSSGFKGVYKTKRSLSKPWCANIQLNGRMKNLGYFSSPKEAAKAYDRKAREIFGKFAVLNYGDAH